MPKLSRVTIVVLLLLLAAAWWLWRDRDTVALALINWVQDAVQVEALSGLTVYGGDIHLDRLRLSTTQGAAADLRGLRLAHPLRFFGAINNSELTVAEARLSLPEQAPEPTSPTSLPGPNAPPAGAVTTESGETAHAAGQKDNELYLSEIIKALDLLPARLEIRQLQWPDSMGGRQMPATVSLQRVPDSTTLLGSYDSSSLRSEVTILPEDNQLQLRAKLNLDNEPASQVLIISADKAQGNRWEIAASTISRLHWLQRKEVPLPIAASGGELLLKGRGRLPDNLLAFSEYEAFWLELSSQDALVSFETDFLPLTLKLATTTPLSTEVLSLRPLQLAQLSGEANVEASVTGSADLPLLSSRVRAQIEGDQAVLNASGSLSPEALLPLLENGPWEGNPGLAIIEEAGGEIFFEASAVLPGMKENTPVRGNDQLWLENANLTIKPGSELRVGAVTDPQNQAPWSRVGWQQALATLKVEAPLTLSTEGWPGKLRLSATDIQGILQEKKGEPAVNFQLSEATCDFAGTTECATAIQANSPQLTFKDSGVTVNDLVLSSSLTFTAGKQQNEIRVSDFFAKATSVTSDPVQATGLLVTASAGRCSNMDKQIHCESAPQVTAESVKTAEPAIDLGGTVAIAPIKLTRLENKLEFHAQYDIAEASVRWEDGGEVNFTGTGELSLTDTLLRGTGQFSTGDIRAQSNWSHNLETTSGSAKLELPRISFSEEKPLSNSVTGLPVDLVAGAVSATAHMSWPADAKDQVQLSLDGVAGVYDKSFATGINTSLRLLRAGDNWVTADPQAVSIDAVDVGIGIKDIRFDLSITEQRDIVLSSLSAKLLEGEINSESLTWNLDDQPRRSLLSASGISLRALEKEMEAENFAASGTLDLQIPVITGPDGITVEAGKVEARPPGGRLRYYGAFSPAMLAGNPQLKMLSGALEDYSFRTLGGTLNYPPSGDMQLQLKLVGRSDSVAKDRDLIINLNLENNVPSMLRSLQASRDLSEALQKNLE